MDRTALVAALAYAAAAGYGARVDLREDVPGEPFGITAPGLIPTHLLVGWGAGTSAPWPMTVAALAVGLHPRPGAGSGTALVALGAASLAGQLVEPVAWGRRPSSAVTRSLVLNLVTSAALVLAGRRTVRAAR